MGRLEGKTAVVTGASSGIGRGTALRFAQEGATVALMARRHDLLEELTEEIRAFGGTAIPIPCDITDREQVAAAVGKAAEKLGRIDILVNNAGMADGNAMCASMDDTLFDTVVDLNLRGTYLMTKACLARMETQKKGTIVNISSIAGAYGYGGFSYASTKAGIIGMTRNLAIQYAGTEGMEIRCNAVCPGPVPTALVSGLHKPVMDPFLEIIARHQDVKVGLTNIEQQVNVILFLASDESSGINGQYIVVDKGRGL